MPTRDTRRSRAASAASALSIPVTITQQSFSGSACAAAPPIPAALAPSRVVAAALKWSTRREAVGRDAELAKPVRVSGVGAPDGARDLLLLPVPGVRVRRRDDIDESDCIGSASPPAPPPHGELRRAPYPPPLGVSRYDIGVCALHDGDASYMVCSYIASARMLN